MPSFQFGILHVPEPLVVGGETDKTCFIGACENDGFYQVQCHKFSSTRRQSILPDEW